MVLRMVCIPFGNLESEMEMKASQSSSDGAGSHLQRGQAVALFALLLPIMSIFAVLIMEYMVTTARMMSAVAAADLAAHAGAQEITVDPDGTIRATDKGQLVAGAYFQAQQMENVSLTNIQCGIFQNRPACRVAVQVQSPGYILPKKWVPVNAVGYLAHGVTRGDQ